MKPVINIPAKPKFNLEYWIDGIQIQDILVNQNYSLCKFMESKMKKDPNFRLGKFITRRNELIKITR